MTPSGHRRLILTRHAKSAWDEPLTDDHDRPLNTRGRAAAAELGQWLASRDYLPDEVICSTAARTAETWERVAAALSGAPSARMEPRLYQAAPDRLLKLLQSASGTCVMMLAHNPGIGEFAAMLPAEPPQHADFARYPTCATLVVDFEIADWADLAPARGSVLDFFVPTERG